MPRGAAGPVKDRLRRLAGDRPVVFKWKRPNLYKKQHDAIFSTERIAVIEASTKVGKAQPLNARIQTPSGWVFMGDVQPGMAVCDPWGGTALVTDVFPQGETPIYRVTFSDGATTECTADHIWEVHADRRDYRHGFHGRLRTNPGLRRRKDRKEWPRVMTLRQLMALAPRTLRRLWVRVPAPLAYDAKPVPVDPYLLGVLLGDGGFTTDSLVLSCRDPYILDRVKELVAPHYALVANGKDHRIALRQPYQRVPGRERILPILRQLGLWGLKSHEKFIPDCYRYNAEHVRREIVRGVLDTDGTVSHSGQPILEQTSPRLARDVAEIVRGLGGLVHTRTKQGAYRGPDGTRVPCRLVYRQYLTVPDAPAWFALPRKQKRCRPKRKPMHRTWRSIEPAGTTQTQCISLDSWDGLYVTDDGVVTHNTAGCILWLIEMALKGKEGHNYWWVAPVSRQSKIAYDRMRRAFPPGVTIDNKNLLTITLPNGAVISCMSGDNPDSLYGEDVFAVVIDEATRTKEGVWHAIRSTMTATQAPVRIIGNVRGRKNWAYQLARRAEKGEPGMHYARLTIYDAVEAGLIPAAEVMSAERDLPPNIFRELYLAEPSDDGGNPFGLHHIDSCVQNFLARTGAITIPDSDGVLRDRGLAYGAIAWGWDLARSANWTVGIGLDDGGLVVRLARWHGIPWGRTIDDIRAYTGTTPALVDQTGVGSPIVEELGKVGNYEGFTFTETSRQQILESLAAAISRHELAIPEGPIAQELREFEYVHVKNRGIRYGAPEGTDDDCVMSLAMAVECRRRARMGMRGQSRLLTL